MTCGPASGVRQQREHQFVVVEDVLFSRIDKQHIVAVYFFVLAQARFLRRKT